MAILVGLTVYILSSTLIAGLGMALLQVERWRIGLLIGAFSGTSDFVVMKYLVPQLGLMDGAHFIISGVLVTLCNYYLLRLSKGGAFLLTILNYMLSAFGELFGFGAAILIMGKDPVIAAATQMTPLLFLPVGLQAVSLIIFYYLLRNVMGKVATNFRLNR